MPTTRPIRVAVLNDYDIVVAGVAALLAPYAARVDVVELDTGVGVRNDVDVVLFDSFCRPGGTELAGIDLGHAKLLVLSWDVDPRRVRESLDAGATGHLGKHVDGAELVRALERVHAGLPVTPDGGPEPPATVRLRWPGDEHHLTHREAEVLALICQGLSNEAIGAQIFLGINTIKTYIRSLYTKIGVESRTQAVLWGIDHGFRPDPGHRERLDAASNPS